MSTPTDESDAVRERLLAAYQQALGHELPNRLVAIQGMVRLLQTEETERLSSEGREFLDQLAIAARRAHELVRGLAEAGQLVRTDPGAEPVLVAEVAREAGAATKQLYPAVAIEYHFNDSLLRLAVGRPALYQVFFRLLQYAVQSASGDQAPRIEVGGEERAGQVELWVAANGRSLSEVESRRLFEPLAQGETAETDMGLSLLLVSQVVSALGGTVAAETTAGRRTTIRIRI